jgi:hypothetical protein
MTNSPDKTPLGRFQHALVYVEHSTEELRAAFEALPEDLQRELGPALVKAFTPPALARPGVPYKRRVRL